jgi:hypothetical protein
MNRGLENDALKIAIEVIIPPVSTFHEDIVWGKREEWGVSAPKAEEPGIFSSFVSPTNRGNFEQD